MKYRFDEEEMLATAKVVLVVNPSARENFDTPQELIDQMKSDARLHLKEPGYLSTYGYVLSAYWHSVLPIKSGDHGTLGIRSSLSTYSVAKHLGTHETDDVIYRPID